MRLLFTLDSKDYKSGGKEFVRPSARAIIIKDNKIAAIHSIKYDYYKFPGGGIEQGESNMNALIRETKEEAGLVVIEESIKEFGLVKRIESGSKDYDIFVQDNYYYLCDIKDEVISQQLDDYENDEGFTLEYVSPDVIINTNRNKNHGPKSKIMIEREALVTEILVKEGFIK